MQKNKRKEFINKFIADFLVIVFLLVSIPMETFADEINKITAANKNKYEEKIQKDKKILKKTENSTLYELEDGLKRKVIHDENVRFYDENNKLTDYDPSLIKIDSKISDNDENLTNYKYENKAGDMKLYIPEVVSTNTPILLENEKNTIKIAPLIENNTSKVNIEKQKTINIYDDEVSLPIKANYEDNDANITYEYISQDNGIKEKLILNENPKSNEFKYEIKVDDNLIPKKCEVEESIIFYENGNEENVVASIDMPYMNDKTGTAYSEDITYDIEKSNEYQNTYILTMTLSKEYLNSSDRVYPVIVDPTITWTGDANLIDTYILSNSKYADTNFYNSGTTAFPIGYTSSIGTCRSLIRSLDLLDTVKDKYVESATLTMYETSGNTSNMTVNAYRIIDSWTKSTVTWNNKPRYNTSNGVMGTVKTTGTLYKARVMDVTEYARRLANKTYSSDKGLMLKTNSDSSSSAGYCKFFGSRHSNSSLRPRFTVEYYDGPTIASSVKLSKSYLKTNNTLKLIWSGIESKALDYVEYRIARRNDETGEVDSVSNSIVKYTQIGTTSNGSEDISTIKDLPEGCYRIIVRGVDKSGVVGKAKGYSFHLDNTKPNINSVSISPSSSKTNKIAVQDIKISLNIEEKHLKDIQYSINNGGYKSVESEISNNCNFTIPKEEFTNSGDYTINIKVIDKSNNVSSVKTVNAYIDGKIPQIGKLNIKDSNNNDISDKWTNDNNIKVEFSDLKDDDSDINFNSMKYALVKQGLNVNDEDYKNPSNITYTKNTSPYSGSFSITSNVETGVYDLYLKVEDKVGNISTNKVTYKKDTITPTASIDVENSDTSTDLNHTVKVIGNVSDEGSGIKDSNVKLYKLDSSNQIIEDSAVTIYDNSTVSVTRIFDTRTVSNGKYRLVLYAEDEVGYSIEKTKDVTIANKIEPPTLTSILSNSNQVTINWKYQEASVEISKIQYKLDGDDNWVDVDNSNKRQGSFNVNLKQNTTGIYKVYVRAVDKYGFKGNEAIVECEIDKENPTVNIDDVANGVLIGTVNDKNLSNWEIYIKEEKQEDTQYTKILEGTSKIENNTIGILDLSNYSNGNYIIKLVGIDKAGNKGVTIYNFTKSDEFENAQVIEPNFIVKRPSYQDDYKKTNKILFNSTIEDLEAVDNNQTSIVSLLKSAADGVLSWYNVTWYINNQKVGEDFSYSLRDKNGNLKYDLSKEYKVSFAIDELFNDTTYNMPLTKNKARLNIDLLDKPITGNVNNLEKQVNLDENIVSFRLVDTNSSLNLKYEVKAGNGNYQEINPTDTIYIKDLCDNLELDKINIRVSNKNGESFNNSTNLNEIGLEIDTIESEYFTISSIENYRPTNLSAKDKVNYKTYLKWELPENVQGDIPEDIYYEIYRGTKDSTGKINYELVENKLKVRYWTEVNINYADEFYYKVRAVKLDNQDKVVETSSFSTVSSRVVDSDELTKRLGITDYWEYAEIDLPNGDVSIEKSKGNLVYQQVDAVLPNEQLEVNLNRTYNNKATSKSCFGIGWNHEYDIELLTSYQKSDDLAEGSLVLKDSEGTLFYFSKQKDGSYISSMGKYINIYKEEQTKEVTIPDRNSETENGKITKVINSSYTMKTKDGEEYLFNSGGQLVYIGETNGNFLLFDYDIEKGLISKITTSKNISMEFVYYNESDKQNNQQEIDVLTIKEVKLPDGSKINYNYTNSRLSSVVKHGSNNEEDITYTYLYDADKNLTQIYDAEGNPYKFEYDDKKRVTKVIYPHNNALYEEAVALEYSNNATQTTTKKLVNGNTRCFDVDYFDNYFGNCIKSIDAEGYITTYEYENNLLKNTTYEVDYQVLENGKVVTNKTIKSEKATYDSDEKVTEEIDEDGTKSKYSYSSESSILNAYSDIDEDNVDILESLPTSLKEYSAEGDLITDEHYKYDEFGNTTEIYDEVTNTTIKTTYTSDGEVASETEILGSPNSGKVQSEAIYTYSYDENGNKTEISKEISDGTQSITTTVYDVMGRVITCEVKFTEENNSENNNSKNNKLEKNTYDSFGRLIYSKHTEGSIVTETSKSYYPNGTIKSETLEDKTVNSYTYDETNRVKTQTVSKGNLTKTWTNEYSYETVSINTGKGTQKTYDYSFVSKEVNPDGKILGVTYQDYLGRTIREKENGVYVDLTYDRNGNTLTKYENGSSNETDKSSLTIYLYDALGNQTTTIQNPKYQGENFYADEIDSIVVSKQYDSQGNVIEETDGEGYVTKYEYDAEDRVTKVTLPYENNITTIEYDKENEDGTTSTIVTDANGNKTETATNSQDLSVYSKNLGNGNITPITSNTDYDVKNNVIKQTDSKGNYKIFEYDDMDRNTAINYFDEDEKQTFRTEYVYDILGNVLQMKDYKVSNNENTLYRFTKYDYDNLKRIVGISELSEEDISTDTPTDTEIESHKITFTYDINDKVTDVTYPTSINSNIKGLHYNYDENEWLQTIYAEVGTTQRLLREYKYFSNGNVEYIKDYKGFISGNTTSCTTKYFEYDKFDRTTKIEYKDSSTDKVLERYEYTYNKNNLITNEKLYNNYTQTNNSESNTPITNETRKYEYDKLGRLTGTYVTNNNDNITTYSQYEYDKVGNRLKEKKDSSLVEYTYNSLNQLLTSVEVGEEESSDSESDTDEDAEDSDTNNKVENLKKKTTISNKTYTYDRNGNQIREVDSVSNEIKNYSYDADNRMSKAIYTKDGVNTLIQNNVYNGSGQRVTKSENGQATNYYYQDGNVLYTSGKEDNQTELEQTPDDYNISTGITSLNLMETDGEVISSVRGVGVAESYYFYNKDLQGSTTNVLNSVGQSEVAYEYTDFGETETKGNENFYNEICYTGGIYDKNTALYYLNARYYNPEDGRFITEDTYTGEYSEPSSLHLYAYCQNNPVNNTDPTGNFPWAIVSAAWDAYDGYKIAKKKKLKGWKCVGYVAGYIAVNSLNPFKVVKKAVKVVKSVKKLKKASKIFKRVKKSKVIAKKIKKVKKVSFKKKHSVKKTTKKKAITATKKRRKGNAQNRAKLNKNKKLCLGNCFTEDTLVLTEDGLVEIDEIEVGDFVWSEDPETGDITLKEVEATFINKTDTLVFINVDGETIKTTEGHLFYVEGIGWIPASMLQEGDSLSLEDGREVPIQSIKIVDYNYYIFVYNFEVEDFHTYYVSDISVLTHNMCAMPNIEIWNKGSFESIMDSLEYHYKKHGKEVGANSMEEYLRKAKEFAKTAKKRNKGRLVKGKTVGTKRYSKNGKYIDLTPNGDIVSFGRI
ncbi:polymorphic toxin-type HINT domain-containing protein [Intestinibacter bartlettii]|uniref:polymorphic toxin-type HINT domain-containing protein n=1 Tax=Intestinibacter bartlettii TaxID=261299 RepID=UPI003992279D